MANAVAFIRWANYVGSPVGPGLFATGTLTYSSSQERLHALKPGDHLWLVSRCPDDQQYYFVACLTVSELQQNSLGTEIEREFGRFAVAADVSSSRDLGKRIPAEGLLRAFEFERNRPIRFGANLGQSLQA